MTLAAEPAALQAAVAAGILGCGSVVLGTAELCGAFLAEARVRAGDGDPAAALRDMAAAIRAAGGKAPGFGHPLHKPVDPRAERILALAEARGVAGPHVALARAAAPGGRGGLGQAAADERLDGDRRRRPRPRLSRRHAEGDPDPRPHRRPARPSRRGAASARSASCSPPPPRRRSPTSPARDARARGRNPALGRPGGGRRRRLPRADRLPFRPLRLLPEHSSPPPAFPTRPPSAASPTSPGCR